MAQFFPFITSKNQPNNKPQKSNEYLPKNSSEIEKQASTFFDQPSNLSPFMDAKSEKSTRSDMKTESFSSDKTPMDGKRKNNNISESSTFNYTNFEKDMANLIDDIDFDEPAPKPVVNQNMGHQEIRQQHGSPMEPHGKPSPGSGGRRPVRGGSYYLSIK